MKKYSIHLSLGSKCNLNCTYCYKDLNYKNLDENSIYKLIDRIFEIFDKNEISDFTIFCTNEPLLDSDKFWRIHDYVVNKGLPCYKVAFTTNGTLIRDSDIERFHQRRYLLLSFDGSKDLMMKYRHFTESQYNELIRKIDLMANKGVRIIGSKVVMPDEEDLMEECKYMYNLGFDKCIIKTVRSFDLSDNDILKILLKYKKFYENLENLIINNKEIFWLYFTGLNTNIRNYLLKTISAVCVKGDNSLIAIDPNGNIFNCDYDLSTKNKNSKFNILDEKFNKEIYENSFKNIDNFIHEDCKNCSYLMTCGGKNLLCSKSNFRLECELSRLRGKFINKISNFLIKNYKIEDLDFIFDNNERTRFLLNCTEEKRKYYEELDKLYSSQKSYKGQMEVAD